jgi:hypothetical protein
VPPLSSQLGSAARGAAVIFVIFVPGEIFLPGVRAARSRGRS